MGGKQTRARVPAIRADSEAPAAPRADEENPLDWTSKQVTQWLQTIGMTKYSKRFADKSIDGKLLLDLEDEQLMKLKVARKKKNVRKLSAEIVKLRKKQSEKIIQAINGRNYDKLEELLHTHDTKARLTKVINPPLIWAALKGDEDVVRLLIHHRSDVDFCNEHGDCALHWAAQEGHVNIVQDLLWCGARVNVPSKTGDTPLICAAWKGHENVVRLLLEFGAEPNMENIEKKSAIHYTSDTKIKALLSGPRPGPPPLLYLCLRAVRTNRQHPACALEANKLPIDLADRLRDLLPT